MAIDIAKKTWLAELARRELSGYDPLAARFHLPADIRDAAPDGPDLEARARLLLVRSLRRRPAVAADQTETPADFLGPIEGHIALIQDLALLHDAPFHPLRREAELAALFAAACDELGMALDADPGQTPGSTRSAVVRAFSRAGQVLRRQYHPAGDPVLGLPLYAGALAIHRRLLARLAISYFRKGKLERDPVERELSEARRELVLLIEVQAGLADTDGPPTEERQEVFRKQIARLRLHRRDEQAALRAALTPRAAHEVARSAPASVALFLLEQLLVGQAARGPMTQAAAEVIEAYAQASLVSPEQLASMQVEAAALQADWQRWLSTFGGKPLTKDELARADDWDAMSERVLERLTSLVTDNVDAIVTEVRQTGVLGQLLAKAAAGKTLTSEEKKKVRAQLIDLAKAVPALAIFAAPGGMLLLPLLAKILPFNVLPSAWDRDPPTGRRRRAGGSKS